MSPKRICPKVKLSLNLTACVESRCPAWPDLKIMKELYMIPYKQAQNYQPFSTFGVILCPVYSFHGTIMANEWDKNQYIDDWIY